ncbi:MAG: ATP-binding cassette domain-containing protein [Eubacteriales bacterium]|nr:ATP-binding cassette domain-containing protein [Eubacteriales bacterium]
MSDIIINEIYKSFGEKKVLDGFSLVIRENRFTALMGKSGCGKTTLINIIMGLIKPDLGFVTGVPAKISAVFQEDRLCDDFNAVSNIYLVTGRKFPKDIIEKCLNDLGLEGSLRKPVRELSGGMRRRVAIARALLGDYDLLILDEPFKELDTGTKESVMSYIKQSAAGKTVLLVTHNKAEADFFSADIAEME